MKLSQIVVLAAKSRGQCAGCGKALKGKQQFLCPDCRKEVESWGEDFVDPNGQQWYTQVMNRLPLVRWTPLSR